MKYTISQRINGYELVRDDGETQDVYVFEDSEYDDDHEYALKNLLLELIEAEHPHNKYGTRNIVLQFPVAGSKAGIVADDLQDK